LHSRLPNYLLSMALAAVCCASAMSLAKQPTGPKKLARPPKWSADVLDVFYPDARQKLVGARPDYQKVQGIAADAGTREKTSVDHAAGAGWSKLISAETIESEIKRIAPELTKLTATPSAFKGGGYKDCRRHFSVLAALFAVDAEYDGEVRWQDAAPTFRDLFSRAGHNCKAGSDQTFQEAKQRRQDLADLIAGARPKAASPEGKADWPKVADRPPLMQRMNTAHEERLTKWLANKSEFTAHRDEVRHESQIVATIADIIGREGFDYWDDEQYAGFARELRQAATDVAAAVELGNFEQAQQAGNRMTKACADCHERFRG